MGIFRVDSSDDDDGIQLQGNLKLDLIRLPVWCAKPKNNIQRTCIILRFPRCDPRYEFNEFWHISSHPPKVFRSVSFPSGVDGGATGIGSNYSFHWRISFLRIQIGMNGSYCSTSFHLNKQIVEWHTKPRNMFTHEIIQYFFVVRSVCLCSGKVTENCPLTHSFTWSTYRCYVWCDWLYLHDIVYCVLYKTSTVCVGITWWSTEYTMASNHTCFAACCCCCCRNSVHPYKQKQIVRSTYVFRSCCNLYGVTRILLFIIIIWRLLFVIRSSPTPNVRNESSITWHTMNCLTACLSAQPQ